MVAEGAVDDSAADAVYADVDSACMFGAEAISK